MIASGLQQLRRLPDLPRLGVAFEEQILVCNLKRYRNYAPRSHANRWVTIKSGTHGRISGGWSSFDPLVADSPWRDGHVYRNSHSRASLPFVLSRPSLSPTFNTWETGCYSHGIPQKKIRGK